MDPEKIQAMIDDAIAGAGEQFAAQAREAAQEAITAGLGDLKTSVQQIANRIATAEQSVEAISPEAVKQAVAETVAAELASRDEQAQADAESQAAEHSRQQAREAFIASNASKIPAAYHTYIPVTDDEGELQAGLDKAVEQLQADAKTHGWQMPDIGATADAGGNGDAATPPTEQEATRSGQDDLKAAYAAG